MVRLLTEACYEPADDKRRSANIVYPRQRRGSAYSAIEQQRSLHYRFRHQELHAYRSSSERGFPSPQARWRVQLFGVRQGLQSALSEVCLASNCRRLLVNELLSDSTKNGHSRSSRTSDISWPAIAIHTRSVECELSGIGTDVMSAVSGRVNRTLPVSTGLCAYD